MERFRQAFGGTVSPNAAKENARQQQSVNVGGTINVNGPPGTTAEATGPVGFELSRQGAS